MWPQLMGWGVKDTDVYNRAKVLTDTFPWGRCGFALRIAALLLCVSMSGVAAARNVALLIGVGALKDPELKDHELLGPPIDVVSVKQTLTGQWGFAPADVHTLLDQQATHDAILAEISALEQRSAPGDTLLIYFSGHGTSAKADGNSYDLPYATGAWIPYDLNSDSLESAQRTLVIGHRDLLPRLKRLDEAGRFVVVVSDSCYSGQVVRAFGLKSGAAQTRYLSLHVRDLGVSRVAPAAAPVVSARPPPAPYPYQHVVLLSGASDSEVGNDLSSPEALARWPTFDNQPHGAFTDAFLRLLKGQLIPGTFNYSEGRQAMYAFLEHREIQQHPQLLPGIAEDPHDVGAAGFLAASTSVPGSNVATPNLTTPGVAPSGTHNTSLRVRLDGASAALRAKIAAIQGIAVVDKDGDLIVHQSGEKVQLVGPAGDPVTATTASDPNLLKRIAAQAWLVRTVPVMSADKLGLRADTEPASRSNTYVQCENFVFEVKLQKPAFVMLLDLDSEGNLTVLYPASPLERRMLPNGVATAIPGADPKDHILVIPPFGADLVTVMAFEKQPSFFVDLTGAQRFASDSSQADSLSRGLTNMTGAISVHQVSVNTYPATGNVTCK
jgi:Caspase domain/Domain of unknown function (DUF4384)